MLQLILGILIFLVGFYCGQIWVTKLAGKTISFSLRGALTVIFLAFVIMVLLVALVFSFRPKKNWSTPSPSYHSDTTTTR